MPQRNGVGPRPFKSEGGERLAKEGSIFAAAVVGTAQRRSSAREALMQLEVCLLHFPHLAHLTPIHGNQRSCSKSP